MKLGNLCEVMLYKDLSKFKTFDKNANNRLLNMKFVWIFRYAQNDKMRVIASFNKVKAWQTIKFRKKPEFVILSAAKYP